MKIKVCGMRDASNINELVSLKPDFIGFIFHEKSTRNVIEKPNVIIPENINKVGVFVNKSKQFILSKIADFNLDFVQLHGNETPEFCKELKTDNIKIIKAFNIKDNFNFEQLREYETSCDYYLFDAFGKKAGGNGITFNWNLLNKYKGDKLFLLSGGIDETMVEIIKNIKHKKFLGIDVNSGFEIEPALKDINKLKTFFKNIKA